MKIVCISDTHGAHAQIAVPEGDLLLHAGDMTLRGKPAEIEDFNAWLGSLPHKYKVVVAGNHDYLFANKPARARALITNAIYLENESVKIEEFNIWGSPATPKFLNWSFGYRRGEEIRKYWEQIPENTDILITHGPPFGILDRTFRWHPVGCADLAEIVEKIQPKLHVFGHIHEHYGMLQQGQTQYINASVVDMQYKPLNLPIVVEL